MFFAKNIRKNAKIQTKENKICAEKWRAIFGRPKTDVEKEKRIDLYSRVLYHYDVPKRYIQLYKMMSTQKEENMNSFDF